MELITAAFCLPIDQDPIPLGGIAIEMGKIVAVGTAEALQKQYPEATPRHFDDQVLLPGLINAHLHIDMAQFHCPEPESISEQKGSPHIQWLKHALTFRQRGELEKIALSIRTSLDRLTRCGTTCIGAFTTFDAAADLISDAGLRAVIYPEIFASGPAAYAQDRFESALALLEKYADEDEHIRLGLGPLAPYLLSRQLLQIISSHAHSDNLPLQIHAAESFDEMEFFFNSSGAIGTEIFPLLGWGKAAGQPLPPPFQKTPIQYLEDIGFLEATPTLVGCIHLGTKDVPILKRRRCSAVFSPRAVAAFQLGEFPYGKLAEGGIPMALGTESLFTPVDGDLWEEMRAALRSGGIAAPDVLHMATLGGAKALNWDHAIGSLTVGKQADYLLVDFPATATSESLSDALIRSTTAQRVRQTVVGGEILKNV